MTNTTETAYKRALAAEPRLNAIVTTVSALCELARADDTMCAGCIWDSIVKPLTTPLIGWSRGYPPKEAADPDPNDHGWRLISGADWFAEFEETAKHRTPATTDTEQWLRTSEAWDAFTSELLHRLNEADPGNGHGICKKQT